MHIQPNQMNPPPIKHRCMQKHDTKQVSYIYIAQCTYTHGRLIPLQLHIDLCKTITPNKFHI